jgi:hypothetical protein
MAELLRRDSDLSSTDGGGDTASVGSERAAESIEEDMLLLSLLERKPASTAPTTGASQP